MPTRAASSSAGGIPRPLPQRATRTCIEHPVLKMSHDDIPIPSHRKPSAMPSLAGTRRDSWYRIISLDNRKFGVHSPGHIPIPQREHDRAHRTIRRDRPQAGVVAARLARRRSPGARRAGSARSGDAVPGLAGAAWLGASTLRRLVGARLDAPAPTTRPRPGAARRRARSWAGQRASIACPGGCRTISMISPGPSSAIGLGTPAHPARAAPRLPADRPRLQLRLPVPAIPDRAPCARGCSTPGKRGG